MSVVNSLTMISLKSSEKVLWPGDTDLQYVYVVMSGFLGVFQTPKKANYEDLDMSQINENNGKVS